MSPRKKGSRVTPKKPPARPPTCLHGDIVAGLRRYTPESGFGADILRHPDGGLARLSERPASTFKLFALLPVVEPFVIVIIPMLPLMLLFSANTAHVSLQGSRDPSWQAAEEPCHLSRNSRGLTKRKGTSLG